MLGLLPLTEFGQISDNLLLILHGTLQLVYDPALHLLLLTYLVQLDEDELELVS